MYQKVVEVGLSLLIASNVVQAIHDLNGVKGNEAPHQELAKVGETDPEQKVGERVPKRDIEVEVNHLILGHIAEVKVEIQDQNLRGIVIKVIEDSI